MKKIGLIAGALISFFSISAQVIINEVSPSNVNSLVDNYGEYPDWVELYNNGTNSVNLEGYALSDDPFINNKWVFPSIDMASGEYLIVYLSGKNVVDKIDHWESPVLESNIWRYTVPTSTTSEDWNENSFDDSSWDEGVGGIGYGDDDDATEISGPVNSIFMRTEFSIVDTSEIQALAFHMDYDDGFIAYINGYEIARGNMTSSDYDAEANSSHESEIVNGGTPREYLLDAKTIKPYLINGTNVLSVQTHNNISTSSDLTSRPFLSFGLNTATTYWNALHSYFTPPSAQVYIHSNFSLNNGKEGILLFNPQGTPIDGINPPEVLPDMSYGRITDGSSTFKMFMPSTPNVTNNGGTSFDGIWEDELTFSLDAGFYSGEQTVSITALKPESNIRYTTDGSKPTSNSLLYSSAISISKTTVLRAGAFRTGYIAENIETNTYVIGESNNPKLPVMSISTNPEGFFSEETGIYELGPNASGVAPNYGANFWEDWEREIHIEYFDEYDQLGIEQDCGAKIFGGWSRDQDMKSLRLIGREEYGDKDFDYPFFKHKNIQSFRQLVLRNSGNDFNNIHFRDGLNHEVIREITNLDYMSFQPVVVFINGEYFGIHNLRERINDNYIQDNHGVDNNAVNLIERDDAKYGDNIDWLETVDFVINNDLSIQSNYDQVKNILDIPNWIDFFAAQTYHINWDAPHNNVRIWRPQDKSVGWRFLYYDTDFGLNLFGGYAGRTAPDYNELERYIEDDRSNFSPMFKNLLTNDEFKCQFATRYADLMNTVYKASNYKAVCDSIKNLMTDDMPEHFDKWGSDFNSWDANISDVKSFLDDRETEVRSHLHSELTGLGTDRTLTLNITPEGSGKIVINTVSPDIYTWSGDYFSGCPIDVTVIPAKGFTFSNWSGANASSNENINLTLGANNDLTANFTVDNTPDLITISEINYNSLDDTLDSGDWIELYNYGTSSVDLSGWTFKDGNDYNGYSIPNGTVLNAGDYLVVAADLIKFSNVNPTVTNLAGPLGFKLSSSGEDIRVYDNYNRFYTSVKYNNKAPWSELADGKGGTLELIDPNNDLNDASSWFGGCLGGSPGAAYSPCPCESPYLGADQYLCESGGNITLNTGLSQCNRTFTWYLNGDKLTDNTPTLIATVEGYYSVLMQSPTCIKESAVYIYNNLKIDLGNGFNLCSPAEATLTVGSKLDNTTYSWFKDNVDLNTSSPSINITSEGNYKIEVKRGLCPKVTSEVNVTTSSPTPQNEIKCGGGDVTLSVTGNNSYKWYANETGGTSLKTGKSYSTTVNETTTYYVEDTQYFGYNIGPDNPDFGDTWSQDEFEDYKARFYVYKDCYLNYVTVYPQGSSTVTVRITTGVNTGVIHEVTVPAISSPQRIYLGKFLEAGSYYMDAVGTDGSLTMTNENASYPYDDADGYLSITRMEPSWASDINEWYFYFYNFEIANSPVQEKCDRTPVTAYTCEAPNTTISSNTTSIKAGDRVEFSSTIDGVYNSVSWDFGPNASPRYAEGIGPHSIVYPVRGIYDVVLTVLDNLENHEIAKSNFITVCSSPEFVNLTSDLIEYCGTAVNLSATTVSDYEYEWYQENISLGAGVLNDDTKQVMNIADYYVVVSDPYNTQLCNTVSNSVSISNCVLSTSFDSNEGLAMYPNPSKDKIHFTGVNGSVEFRDTRGVLLFTADNTDKAIDISSLKQGLYIVSVKSLNQDHLFKLIKE